MPTPGESESSQRHFHPITSPKASRHLSNSGDAVFPLCGLSPRRITWAPAGFDHASRALGGIPAASFAGLSEVRPMFARLPSGSNSHTTSRSSLRKSTGDAPAEVHRNAVRAWPLTLSDPMLSICRVIPTAANNSALRALQLNLGPNPTTRVVWAPTEGRGFLQDSTAPDLWLRTKFLDRMHGHPSNSAAGFRRELQLAANCTPILVQLHTRRDQNGTRFH
jgi:hypothetical protein